MFTFLKNSKKGFTLIELLVVVAIIGLLSAIVLASLSTSRMKGRDARRISDVGQIQLALELYYDGHRSYPSTTPTCSPACVPAGGTTDTAIRLLAQANLLKQVPIPPVGGSLLYIYKGTYLSGGAVTECTAIGRICTSYALGLNLERDDSLVLRSDVDQTFPIASPVFYGDSQDCLAAKTGPELCYDVIK